MLKDRLVKLRKEKRKTQDEIAKIIGVTRPAYTAYERGNRTPDYDILEALADYFEVSTDYLLGRTDQVKDNSSTVNEGFDSLYEINTLLRKYGIDQSGFFNIEKWKTVGPEGIKQLENYFQFIVQEAEKQNKDNSDQDKK